MTVRGNKRLVLVALGVVGLGLIVNAGVAFLPNGQGVRDLANGIPFLFFLAMLSMMWNRLGRLEAEHGADYVEPPSPHARRIFAATALAAVALAAVAVLVAR